MYLPYIWGLLVLVGAYLIGSISFAVIFSKLFTKKDVRDFGSGNAGMTNVMRVSGVLPGVLTFVFDLLKGFAAACFGGYFFSLIYAETGNIIFSDIYGRLLGTMFCMLGHVFPIFFGFKGGKGVATGVGAYFAVAPISSVLGLAAFGVTFGITGIISIGSLIGTATVVITAFAFFADKAVPLIPQAIIGLISASLIFFRHKENIIRLIHGEEKKLKVKKK